MLLDRRGTALNLLVAVGQPLLLVGLATGLGYLTTSGAEDWTNTVVTIVLLVSIPAIWVAGIALSAGFGWIFVGSLASAVAMGAVLLSISDNTLHERGVRTTCDVLAVDKRVVTETHYEPVTNPDGTPGGGRWRTTTTTYYDHRLRCDEGPINAMSLRSRAAEAGQRLEITYDPLQRVGPLPTNTVTDGSGSQQIAVITTLVAVVCRVGGVLRER